MMRNLETMFVYALKAVTVQLTRLNEVTVQQTLLTKNLRIHDFRV
jgi:hypothetical protein